MCAGSEPSEDIVSLQEVDDVTLDYTDRKWAPDRSDEASESYDEGKGDNLHPCLLEEFESGDQSAEVGEISFSQHLLSGDALTVMAVPYTSDGKLVMGERNPEEVSSGGGKYSFPGGFIDWKEQPSNAVSRELQEELSQDITVADYTPLFYMEGENEFSEDQIGSEEFAPPCIVYGAILEESEDQVREMFGPGEFSQLEFVEGPETLDFPNAAEYPETNRNTQRALQAFETYRDDFSV